MYSYDLRPRNGRRASRASGALLGAKRQTSTSPSDTYNLPEGLCRDWEDTFLGPDNSPKIPDGTKEILEHEGLRKGFHEWRKLARLTSSYQANGLEGKDSRCTLEVMFGFRSSGASVVGRVGSH